MRFEFSKVLTHYDKTQQGNNVCTKYLCCPGYVVCKNKHVLGINIMVLPIKVTNA